MAATGDSVVHLEATHTVVTPEFVEFNFVLAGLMSRFLALMIDSLISMTATAVVSIAIFAVVALTTLAVDETAASWGTALLLVAWFVIDWGYMVLFEVLWSGQTIGKRVMGLRVIQDTGVRVTLAQSLLRNLVRPLDKLFPFYAVGGVAVWLSNSQQRLGDALAGTLVIRERKLKIPAPLTRPEGDVTLLSDTVFQQRVRKLNKEEMNALLSAALRREELSVEARLVLFGELARHVQEKMGFAKPMHLSDEKLILLVIAALAPRRQK